MKQDKSNAAAGGFEWKRFIKKLSPYMIKKGLLYFKHYGPKEFFIRLQERFEPEEVPYGPWYESYIPDEKNLEKQRKRKWKEEIKISVIVPAFRTPEKYLREMIESLQNQTYSNWELCIANGSPDDETMKGILKEYSEKDGRICVQELHENKGISGNTNAAFEMATGKFVALLDHDDLIAPNALYEIADYLENNPETDIIYTDEDKITADQSEHFQPHFKPDYNPDLLNANNYICHFFVVKKSLVEKTGGFRSEFDGAQDYDFIFRCIEQAKKIGHIPEILYHWRTHSASTADNPASKMYAFEAGKRAIEGHLLRTGVNGIVSHTSDFGFYRVQYPVQENSLISIIIPNKDEKEALERCLTSIWEKSTYKNYEIILIENNSTTPEIFQYYKELARDGKARILKWTKEFNYAAINNYGVRHAKGEYLLFLNNDMEVIAENWLEELLGTCQREDVGAVGARLYYPDDTIQHAGCVIGMGGIAGHMFTDMKRERTGYLHKAALMQDMSAVTAACMMMKKNVFEAVGGFTEELAVAFNDIDLCLKVRDKGFLIVYNPYVELYHIESKTRGAEDDKKKIRRFQNEIEYMRSHWIDILKNGDPYYNKNLSLTKWNYSLKPIASDHKREDRS